MPPPIRPRPNPEQCVRARVFAGFSLPQAADKLGRSRKHLANVEAGDSGASPGLLKAMADLYGVNIETLVTFVSDAA